MLYRRLLQQLSMVFGPVKKSSENVYISLKTKSKHQFTYYKIQINSKVIYLKIIEAVTGDVL